MPLWVSLLPIMCYSHFSMAIVLFQLKLHNFWRAQRFVSYIFLQKNEPRHQRLDAISSNLNFIFQIISTGFLTFINCYDVKFTTKLQNVFMFTKIAALVIVIIVGVVWMAYGEFIEF